MCGIAGYYCPDGIFGTNDLKVMGDALQHRGPDADGIFADGAVGMVHRRLSIIDLSKAANQPMVSACGRYVIVYNGEVYNYREIGREIEKLSGLKLKTHSDTEVVLEAFALWGAECVKRFNGMFAFAVFDKKTKELFMLRDRVGIKPLFVFKSGTTVVFASEIKALKSLKWISKHLHNNKESFSEFLHLGYIPEPNTAWKEISKFPSGHYARYDGITLNYTPYWNPGDCLCEKSLNDEKEALHYLKELMISSVKMRLISDVPFGTFLSGGIDSSLVTAIAQSIQDIKINTFSIGFSESEFDESKYARAIAESLGTNHHEFVVTENEALELLPGLLSVYDEPFGDSSAIPTLLISAMARKHVTMTLSGDGGDELFMGYGAYQWAQRLNSASWKAIRKPAGKMLRHGNSRQKRIADMLLHDKRNLHSHIFSQEQYLFTAGEIGRLLTEKPDFEGIPLHLAECPKAMNPAEQQAFYDLTHYLKDDLLVKVDRASMHYSLETRVPLLDYRIVEFALNLDYGLKYQKGTSKYLLKKLLYSYLPEKLFNRPKQGFAIPLRKWLKGPLKEWMMDSLSERAINKYGIVNQAMVRELIGKYLNTDAEYLYNRIWVLMMLHNFLGKNN